MAFVCPSSTVFVWSVVSTLPGPFYRNAPDGPAATGAQTALLSQQESVFSFYFTSRCPGLVCPFRLVIPCCRVGYLSQDVQESMLVCHLSSSRVSLSVLRLGISERQGRQIVIVQGSPSSPQCRVYYTNECAPENLSMSALKVRAHGEYLQSQMYRQGHSFSLRIAPLCT